MAEQFKPGNVVQLKSGGLAMTITDINGDNVRCIWFGKEGHIEVNNFYPTSLQQCDAATIITSYA